MLWVLTQNKTVGVGYYLLLERTIDWHADYYTSSHDMVSAIRGKPFTVILQVKSSTAADDAHQEPSERRSVAQSFLQDLEGSLEAL